MKGERGSISVLSVAVLAVTGMALVLLGELGAGAVQRARATAVADVVAMAAAADPQSAAAVAGANGAVLTSTTRDGFEMEVVVRLGEVSAAARAELLPPGWWLCHSLPTGDPVHFESCPSTPVG